MWKISEQGIILETKSLGGGDGDGEFTSVSDPITLPFIGENTSGVEALQLLFLSLSFLPLGKGIPDRKMGLISETAVGYQVCGPCWEKGHEQSHKSFLLYRDEAKISCNTEMY